MGELHLVRPSEAAAGAEDLRPFWATPMDLRGGSALAELSDLDACAASYTILVVQTISYRFCGTAISDDEAPTLAICVLELELSNSRKTNGHLNYIGSGSRILIVI